MWWEIVAFANVLYEKFCSFLYGNVKLIWGWCLIWIIVMHFIQLWVSVKRIAVFAVMVCCGTSCNSCAIDSMLVFSDRLAGASVLVSCEEVVTYLMSYVSCDEILQCIWSVGLLWGRWSLEGDWSVLRCEEMDVDWDDVRCFQIGALVWINSL